VLAAVGKLNARAHDEVGPRAARQHLPAQPAALDVWLVEVIAGALSGAVDVMEL
jgi:hypothetical protein